ncbi:MAG TPA: ABC transporter substrate-binding protein, partial [Acidimicrobiia bacterium]|nr:ABC transporter substrate-binding protein [Acidimicrobiia bacterium]
GLAIVLTVAACGNSESSKSPDTTRAPGGPTTTASASDLETNVPVTAPGVTNDEIDVAAIVTKTNNPTGASYGPLVDGVKAYFKMVNDHGGIYGRKLVVKYDHDDGFNQRPVVQQSLAQDKAFATFLADALFTGADLLAEAKQPTFVWNINPEFAGHPTFFAQTPALCYTCAGHLLPYLAKQLEATKVGVLAYGIAQQSKDCAKGIQNSFAKYPIAQVAYFNDSLAYAQPLGPEVTAMKKKGVTFVMTCVDLNESFTLGKEMQKQGMRAVQSLPNGYDATFVSKNAALFEGDIVTLGVVALEVMPQLPEIQNLYKYTREIDVPVSELTVYGWILASELYAGLAGAGPNFSQAAVVSALNRMTAFSDNGFIPPIDWSKGHIDPEKHPEALSAQDCTNAVIVRNGKFVPYLSTPDKPWTCFNRNDPTVDNPRHVSFAP